MKPVDTVKPALPGNPLRRVEDKRRPKDDRRKDGARPDDRDRPARPGHGDHLIDELA